MTNESKDIIARNTVDIHGKSYLTVAGRVGLWHEDNAGDMFGESKYELVGDYVVCSVVVKTKKGTFSGISAVSLTNSTSIEKQSPFEVAETSAYGRALGFAGYGITESIASADELVKAGATSQAQQTKAILANAQARRSNDTYTDEKEYACETCGSLAYLKTGVSKAGNPYTGVFCSENREHVTWIRTTADLPTPKEAVAEKKKTTSQTETNQVDKAQEGKEPDEEVDPEDIPF